jgi:hypothetical protein
MTPREKNLARTPERASPAPAGRARVGDIPLCDWLGGAINCAGCVYCSWRDRPEPQGCVPGHACMQDAYARRIDRFFRWHPQCADEQLAHPYFEVRALAARYASIFKLPALIDDADETVRLQVALRLPQALLVRLLRDPHREVRLRVAQRIEGAGLRALRDDPDYGVREQVARRLPAALLASMVDDVDRSVRKQVAQRLALPGLLRMADDVDADVRRVVAERLPAGLLSRMVSDSDWRVRWEVAQRGEVRWLPALAEDADVEVSLAARQRLAHETAASAGEQQQSGALYV